MRNFVFTPDWYGFIKWLQSINKMKRIIIGYENTQSESYKFSIQAEYGEAWKSYRIYRSFRETLTEKERNYIDAIIKHHTPEWHDHVDTKALLQKWIDIVVAKGFNLIHEITDEEVGLAIKNAREMECKNRTEVAVVVGIKPVTLKAYEEGKRSIPFPVFFKLNQILNITSLLE